MCSDFNSGYNRNQDDDLYNNHLLNGTLNRHCTETEAKAEARLVVIIKSDLSARIL